MAKWLVRLIGHEFDLKTLSELFASSDLSVREEKDGYFLRSSDFDELTEEGSVRSCVVELLHVMNGIAKTNSGDFHSVALDDVVQVSAEGKKLHHMVLITEVRTRAEMDLVAPTGAVSTPNSDTDSGSWVTVAKQNPRVSRALRIFGNREHNWDNLYKVYDAIEDDVGKSFIVQNCWATEKKINLFTRTANNVHAVGDEARHGHEKHSPPKNPMSLSEAESLIKRIIQNWVCSKSQ